jgi:Uma2 family endonuclease
MRVLDTRIPTFAELYRAIEALPEGVTGEILEPGVIRTMGRPGGPHRFSATSVRDALESFDRKRSGTGRWFEVEAEIRFPGDLLAVPDLSGWRVSEAPPQFIRENPIRRIPDWACEVLSASTERKDRDEKLPMYARSGVGWIWLVDPDRRVVEVYQARDGAPSLSKSAEGDTSTPLPPFDRPFSIGSWWLPAD